MLTNVGRAESLMRDAGVDALIAWSPSNVRYLTGYSCWLEPLFREFMVRPGGSGAIVQRSYCLLPLEGDPCLVVEPLWAIDATSAWVSDVRSPRSGAAVPPPASDLPPDLVRIHAMLTDPAEPRDLIAVLADAVRERGLGGSRVGVELEALPDHVVDALTAGLHGVEFVDCTSLLRLVRAVKTEGEIEQLARAAAVGEAAALAALAASAPRNPVSASVQVFREHAAARGAEVDHFTYGLWGLGITTGGSRPLPANQALYCDFGVVREGWYSDSGTTFYLGEPSAAVLEDHAAVVASVDAGAALLRPGVRGSEVQAAMQEALSERGIVESFPHGHGVGLEVRDYPILVPDTGLRIQDGCVDMPADLLLEPNMVVNLEAPVFVPGLHSVHCEQTFVVTTEGPRSLIRQKRDTPILGTAAETSP